MGSGEGLCPPQLGIWGLSPEKNQFCAKNYVILSKFWYFFPILHHKVGGLSQVLKVGDLSPCPPAPTPMSTGRGFDPRPHCPVATLG